MKDSKKLVVQKLQELIYRKHLLQKTMTPDDTWIFLYGSAVNTEIANETSDFLRPREKNDCHNKMSIPC
jgi:hypothetical protein